MIPRGTFELHATVHYMTAPFWAPSRRIAILGKFTIIDFWMLLQHRSSTLPDLELIVTYRRARRVMQLLHRYRSIWDAPSSLLLDLPKQHVIISTHCLFCPFTYSMPVLRESIEPWSPSICDSSSEMVRLDSVLVLANKLLTFTQTGYLATSLRDRRFEWRYHSTTQLQLV